MKKTVAKSAAILMFVTILAKIIGFVREALIGYYYGANEFTDIYYTASGFVTGALFAMTASISVAFIPIYMRSKQRNNDSFFLNCIVTLSAIAIMFTILIEIFAPFLSIILAPSYDAEASAALQIYLRLFAIGILFSLLANLFVSVLNAESRFGYAAISGLVYSLICIIFVTLFHDMIGLYALILSVIIAYFIQCIILLLRCRTYISFPCKWNQNKGYIFELFKLSFPVLISNTTVEINHLVDRALASGIEEGAVSALSYTNTLFNLVFQVICNTFITIYFTEIAHDAVNSRLDLVEANLKQCAAIIILVVTPITIITNIYGIEIVEIAFKRGSFDDFAVKMTGESISVYALSFILAGLYMLLNKVYYSLNNYKLPTLFCIISVICNIILDFQFSKIWGLNGIVSATVISNLILTVLLTFGICKVYKFELEKAFVKNITQCLLSGTIVYVVLKCFKKYIDMNSAWIAFVLATLMGFLIYFLILCLLRNESVEELKRILRNKLHKAANN